MQPRSRDVRPMSTVSTVEEVHAFVCERMGVRGPLPEDTVLSAACASVSDLRIACRRQCNPADGAQP